MELTSFGMLAAGSLATVVLIRGRVAALANRSEKSRLFGIRAGDFLRYNGDIVRVDSVGASKVRVRSHSNRIYTVSWWKLFFQNIGAFFSR